jgi:hypothetical protein
MAGRIKNEDSHRNMTLADIAFPLVVARISVLSHQIAHILERGLSRLQLQNMLLEHFSPIPPYNHVLVESKESSDHHQSGNQKH